MRFDLECRPRFDHGRSTHELDIRAESAAFHAPVITAHLQSTFALQRDGDDVRGRWPGMVHRSAITLKLLIYAPSDQLQLDIHVDALARAGRLRKARYTFEKMQTYANHVGLFAEEVGPSGEQLGNFPQAFTHLSLIVAASTLDDTLDAQQRR